MFLHPLLKKLNRVVTVQVDVVITMGVNAIIKIIKMVETTPGPNNNKAIGIHASPGINCYTVINGINSLFNICFVPKSRLK
jgi:hypothetical protein